MKLFNTLTRKLEEFNPLDPSNVTFYHCGPTVYWTQHIGNMRGMTMADFIRRSLLYLNYRVTFVRNYTDVGHLTSDADEGEDKMEKASKREHLTPDQIAEKYITEFETDTKKLNILVPNHQLRASHHVKGMIDMIQILLNTKHAYIADLAIYFDTSTFPNYYQLNKQKKEENIGGAGKGTVEDTQKKHPSDFVLWFFKKGDHAHALQTWDSPWGEGFPGWHIECSVMAKQYLGETIDIHMGGIEHISVHHTNEIAQSESANGKPFVHYWLHNEHLVLKTGKMAKSQGTGFSVTQIQEKGVEPLALRYFFLTAHYRTKQEFSWEALEQAKRAYENLLSQVSKVWSQEKTHVLSPKGKEYKEAFQSALENDVQIPQALAITWNVLKDNQLKPNEKMALIKQFDTVLGLDLFKEKTEKIVSIPQEIIDLAEQRKKAKENKDFNKADALRKEIEDRGYIISDNKEGYVVHSTIL